MRQQDLLSLTLICAACSVAGCNRDSNSSPSDYSNQATAPATTSTDIQPPATDTHSPVTESSVRSPGLTDTPSEGASPETVAARTGNLLNGLFPDWPQQSTTLFGGGLFPQWVSSQAPATDVTGNERRSGFPGFDPTSEDATTVPNAPDPSVPLATLDSQASAEKEPTLLIAAHRLFDEHREAEATNLLYVNFLVSDATRTKYSLAWYPGLKEPRLFFRWGAGVIFNKPRELLGRHPVIGDPGDENELVEPATTNRNVGRPGNTRGPSLGSPGALGTGGTAGASGTRTYKNVDTSRPDGFLLFFTGDFGEKLIQLLENRIHEEADVFYGSMLTHIANLDLTTRATDNEANTDADSSSSQASASIGLVDDAPPAGRDSPSGSDAAAIIRTDTSVIERAMGSETAQKPDFGNQGTILPGVMLLGVGSRAELIERARAAGVDGLLLFNVKIIKSGGSRRGSSETATYSNSTNLRVVDVKTGENLFSTKTLKDIDVHADYDEGSDPVQIELEKAFTTVCDVSFKAEELPPLKAEVVIKRVGRLLEANPENPLPAAVEIVSYWQNDLLADDLATQALQRLFASEDAHVLVDGDEPERTAFLEKWIP